VKSRCFVIKIRVGTAFVKTPGVRTLSLIKKINCFKKNKIKSMTLIRFKNGNGSAYPAFRRSLSFPSLFSDALEQFWSDEEVSWMPSANIKERTNDFKIDLAVPGMDKKDFHVEVENGLLTVSGERKEEAKEENEKLSRREFHYGSFKRSFSLPETADAENINGQYKDGVLSITIAKRDDSKLNNKKQIVIE
jgi:HSP20 family protein